MSRSLDQLNKAVTNVVKDASGKSFTKDNLIELIDDNIGFLRNASQFFINLGEAGGMLQKYVEENRKTSKLKSIVIYNQMFASTCSMAQKAFNERFLGALQDTVNGLTLILEECNDSIDDIFADKNITLYNTKVSQIAVIGMIVNAKIVSQFVVDYISLFMSDRSAALPKPAPYVMLQIDQAVPVVIEMINRMLGQKLSKTFVAGIKKYRSAGHDTTVVNSDNKATTQFAKVNNDVTDSDIVAGSKGIIIFKWIGDWWVDRTDRKIRKLRAERDMLQSRVRLLQLELNNVDENSPEYKHQVEVIKNYQKLIDRLNQQLAKYDEE